MKRAILLQARMGSSRLPGKVLRPLAGKPMIGWIVARLSRSRLPVVLATSTSPADDALAAWGSARGLDVFRGAEADVLDRFYRCAQARGLEAIVRATGDNPFVDPIECDRLLELHERSGAHYACAFPQYGSGLPIGVGLEVMSFEALQISWREGNAPHHREHVNELVLEQPERFGRAVLEGLPEHRAADLELTVDTAEQHARAERIYQAYLASHDDELCPLAWVIAHARNKEPL